MKYFFTLFLYRNLEYAEGLPYGRFEASTYGFMSFAINQEQLQAQCIDHEGKTVYSTRILINP
ncbi:hypothetical protein [Sphingobacterium pedocola]|uniref:Uncharacterized protein n=1 Tax=Sphingobacterium pedocola TaxID=2082722 RepID=A0ABR9TB70_9SPHI|nr:hypothetical protein [Sphingobacterium pedocola]MBE8722615.1 hypothetical protein [Sphingobacterium pedocola]